MNKSSTTKEKRSYSPFRPKLSMQEQALFAKRLALLVKAGIPLLKSITIMKNQASTAANKAMFHSIADDIENGQFLAKSLGNFKKVFGDFAINVIRVGESSGTLAENLKYLSDEIEKKRKLRQKVIGAMVYPLVIMVAAFSISALMTVYLFPKLLPVFKSLNVELPLMTRGLLFMSDFLINHWFLLLVSIGAFVVAFIFLMRGEGFRFIVHKMILKMPLVGSLFTNYHLTNMCRTLGMLAKSQVRVLEAITITSDTSTSLVYRKQLKDLHLSVTRGGSLAKFFEKDTKLFPTMLSQMVAVGETTGNLSETLLYLAEMYESELDDQTKRLSSIVEPAMMLFMGLLVGIIAVSIITPIYEVTQHLSPK